MVSIGDRVMVYEDPYTRDKPEGIATVTGVMMDATYANCLVLFDDEPDMGSLRRTVYTGDM